MKTLLFTVVVLLSTYGCLQLSGKESFKKSVPPSALAPTPPEGLRVGREDAMRMRRRRGGDDASVKISAKDLLSLMSGPVAENDSFIFYFVKLSEEDVEKGNKFKMKKSNWSDVSQKPSSLLVGFLQSNRDNLGMRLNHTHLLRTVRLYDLAVLCPPPPDCACEIEQ